jgi:hypothetical protein
MIKTFALAAASAIVMASGALAEEYAKYGSESGWTIWANKTSGGCFLENRNNNGNTVQMGLRSNKANQAFLGVWNHAESIMKKGETRDMRLDIDGGVYTFVAKANIGVVSEGLTGAYMYLNNPDFIADIENGNVMTVHTTDSTSFEIDLTGTKKGIARARECFAALNS